MTGVKILVADDNIDAGDALGMLLELQGHEVQLARDGPSALKIAQAFRPQLVLLDLGMPLLDGYATATAIRGQPWGADMYLVAVTGHSQPADRQRAERAGIDLFVVKPIEFEVLERVCLQVATRNAGA